MLAALRRSRTLPAAAVRARPFAAAAAGAAEDAWEVVVGLEFHVQVMARTKLFSPAPAASGAAPNTAVAPFDAATPGSLPVLNAAAVAAAARLGMALGGEVQKHSQFDRKHYFYTDLPHGYQITQQRAPIVLGGTLWLDDAGAEEDAGDAAGAAEAVERVARRGVAVERVQLEMDTGKSVHTADCTLLDLNRAGCALLEVVTAPQLRSGAEAAAAVRGLQRLLRHAGVGSGALEDGSLRADVNVSVRQRAPGGLTGGRTEVKNLNSTRAVARAVRYEAARHIALLAAGTPVPRQTLSFDAATGRTVPMRDKEAALDYRFMPEPDVPPIVLSDAYLAAIRAALPELPDAAQARLATQYGLAPGVAAALVAQPGTLSYFERTVAAAAAAGASAVDARTVANWITGELVGAAREAGVSAVTPPDSASPQRLAELLSLVASGTLSARMAKPVLAAMLQGDARPLPALVEALCGGARVTDDAVLRKMCSDVLDQHPKQVRRARTGSNACSALTCRDACWTHRWRSTRRGVTA